MYKRRLTAIFCAVFLIITIIAITQRISCMPDGSIDLVEIKEINKYTEEELQTKLLGQYRVNINEAWGPPKTVAADIDIYEFTNVSYRLSLQYDSKGHVVNLVCDKIG